MKDEDKIRFLDFSGRETEWGERVGFEDGE